MQAGWNLPDSDTFFDEQEVIDTVRSGRAWGAIIVNQGADARLNDAAFNGNVNYDPKTAITLVYDEGRDPSTVRDFVVFPMRELAQQFQVEFAPSFINRLNGGGSTSLNSSSSIASIASQNPSILAVPVSWTEINVANLTPENSFVTFAGLGIGNIMVIIFTYAAVLVCAKFF